MSESPLVHKAGGASVDPEDFNALVDVVASGGGAPGGGSDFTTPVTVSDYGIAETGLTIMAPTGAADDGDTLMFLDSDLEGGGFTVDAAGVMSARAVGGYGAHTISIEAKDAILVSGTTGDTLITAALAGESVWIAASDEKLGFLGATPGVRPTVSGSRGGNAALASLLTALANMGLITNSTTA